MNKTCYRCLEEKNIKEFSKKKNSPDGYNTVCKGCKKIERKKHNESNKDKISKAAAKYYKENREKILKQSSEYNKKFGKRNYQKNKEKSKKTTIAWKKANPEKVAAQRKRYKQKYKLRNKMSKSIAKHLKIRGGSKGGQKTWGQILKYTVDDLKEHLENQFESGMSWDNYGLGPNKWCIDHIVPDSHFKYNSIHDEGFKKSWGLDNLQPMWFCQNASKGNRYSGAYDPSI